MEERFLTPEAVTKLLQVKQHILEEPDRLCMMNWATTSSRKHELFDYLDGLHSGTGRVPLDPPCGTVGCIAGWICILNNLKGTAGPGQAIEILTEPYCNRSVYTAFHNLFHTSRWDANSRERFATTNLRQRASVAAEQIDRFIERYKIAA